MLQYYYDLVHTWKATPQDVAGWGYMQTDGGFTKGSLGAYSTGPFMAAVVASNKTVLANLGAAQLPHLGKPTSFWEEFGVHGSRFIQE